MNIRDFKVGDERALYVVFRSAVHELASRHYTTEQINAWASQTVDPVAWAQRMQSIAPFVAEDAGQIVAYADLQPSGNIDHFFVCGARARQGIGSMLMRRIHELAAQRGIEILTSEVSRSAQPFFEKFGFVIVEQTSPIVRGVVVPNARMRKRLVRL